jgi:hypothetical protein
MRQNLPSVKLPAKPQAWAGRAWRIAKNVQSCTGAFSSAGSENAENVAFGCKTLHEGVAASATMSSYSLPATTIAMLQNVTNGYTSGASRVENPTARDAPIQ